MYLGSNLNAASLLSHSEVSAQALCNLHDTDSPQFQLSWMVRRLCPLLPERED